MGAASGGSNERRHMMGQPGHRTVCRGTPSEPFWGEWRPTTTKAFSGDPRPMKSAELEVLQGTLDMFILKAVSFAPRHGYAILEWLRQTTRGEIRIEDAALYPALHRLEARGFIDAEWGLSENNRRGGG